MSTKPEVHTERSLCCSYRFVVLDKRFHNESAMLACPIHMDNLKQNEKANYESEKNPGIVIATGLGN